MDADPSARRQPGASTGLGMKVLVSNLGSTSFKYKVFDMPSARVLARGGMDRIGGEGSVHRYQIGDANAIEQACSLPDHARAIDEALGTAGWSRRRFAVD